jgi:hypothetical protein
MYLYVTFFNENILWGKKCYFSRQYLEPIKNTFPNYQELDDAKIDGCIGFIKGNGYRAKNCFALNITKLKVDENSLAFEFEIEKELDIMNEFIDKSLYKYARQENWINNEIKYYPMLCILEKVEFNLVRKGTPNTRKLSSNSAKIDEYRLASNWNALCDMYEPLDKVSEKEDIWFSDNDLYQLAFACSKIGEPKNGLERDKGHLEKVKRYREFSLVFFKRCYDLKPTNFRNASAVAYRHYLNTSELTKQRGRRDGKVSDELSEAIKWFDIALGSYPNSIKDNYRKGKLILEKQIEGYKKAQKEWTKETYLNIQEMERAGIKCLELVITEYENIDIKSEKKNFYRSEYVKALYCLGCYYIENPKNIWNDFVCCKMLNKELDYNVPFDDIKDVAKAKDIFEKCFHAETDISFESELDVVALSRFARDWAESPMDKLYRLGQVYLAMFFIKNIINQKDEPKVEAYGLSCEKYLTAARKVGDELKRTRQSGRSTGFISERLAHYYIISGNYDSAISLIERSNESFIKNTYAIALLLSNKPERFTKAEAALISAAGDNYNQAKDISTALLAYVYKLSGNKGKLVQFNSQKKALNHAANRLLLLMGEREGLNED